MRTRGIHHVVLTVTDVTRSTDFYEKVLGMQALQSSEDGSVLVDGEGMLCLRRAARESVPTDRFDENRVGLDHVAFSVAGRAELESMLEVLQGLKVQTAGIEYDPDGQAEFICFRDPDNIQVEVYVWSEYSSGRVSLSRLLADRGEAPGVWPGAKRDWPQIHTDEHGWGKWDRGTDGYR